MYRLFLLCSFLLALVGCGNSRSPQKAQENVQVLDSLEYRISFEGNKKVEEYKDSIKIFYPNGKLSTIIATEK